MPATVEGSAGPASVMIHHDGANYTMTVTETPLRNGPDAAATWVLFGHDG